MTNKAAASAASLFVPPDENQPERGTHAVTLRIPVDDFHVLCAMASRAGISRSAMGNRVLSAGIEAIRQLLPDDANDVIDELALHLADQYEEN